ncbi:hypothetical protein [Aeromonas phage ZPAH34]|uniref:hypothetical protein n=1 Tax=Aeromonas phage ZPAH34 TaxID=2924888 RepID=UPI0023293943|nr:hypothetical protein PQD16_gp179 [Aeromonas phage ZPAH34]UOX39504.1 hypothetical protein [Aeromonas phage ZPAH34]
MKTFSKKIKNWFMIEPMHKTFTFLMALCGSLFGIFELKGFGTFTYPIAIWYLLSLYWREDKLFSNKEIIIYVIAIVVDSTIYINNHGHF